LEMQYSTPCDMEQIEHASATSCWPFFCNPADLFPSTHDLKATYSGPDEMLAPGFVTLMIRHLPRTYTFKDIRAEIDAVVPSCAYNYIHLPWDCKRKSNINYVFVNCASPEWALRTFLLLSGKSWSFVQCSKVCRIAGAFLQGLGKNLANYVLSSKIQTGHPSEPVVFTYDGQRMDLQLAVKTFCTAEDFYIAKVQNLKEEGATGAALSSKANTVQSEIATEIEASKLSHDMLTKDNEHEHVATYASSSSISSSCSFSMHKSGLQQDKQSLQTCASPDSASAGSIISDKVEFPQSLSYQASVRASSTTSSSSQSRDIEQNLNFSGLEAVSCHTSNYSSSSRKLRESNAGARLCLVSQGPNSVSAGDALSPVEPILTTRTRRHLVAHNNTLKMLKEAGMLSHEFVQRTADPDVTAYGSRIWFVPSQGSRNSSLLDASTKRILDSIQFYAVGLHLSSEVGVLQ